MKYKILRNDGDWDYHNNEAITELPNDAILLSDEDWDNRFVLTYAELLNQAKEAKIAEIKERRDIENIKPLIRQGNLVNPTTMEILPETIQFYFVATRHPTNQASDAGTLLEQAQKRGLIPYFTKNVATNEKAVIALTAELSINIENHLLNRNATNYYHYGQLEAQINSATTIEQVEAITW